MVPYAVEGVWSGTVPFPSGGRGRRGRPAGARGVRVVPPHRGRGRHQLLVGGPPPPRHRAGGADPRPPRVPTGCDRRDRPQRRGRCADHPRTAGGQLGAERALRRRAHTRSDPGRPPGSGLGRCGGDPARNLDHCGRLGAGAAGPAGQLRGRAPDVRRDHGGPAGGLRRRRLRGGDGSRPDPWHARRPDDRRLDGQPADRRGRGGRHGSRHRGDRAGAAALPAAHLATRGGDRCSPGPPRVPRPAGLDHPPAPDVDAGGPDGQPAGRARGPRIPAARVPAGGVPPHHGRRPPRPAAAGPGPDHHPRRGGGGHGSRGPGALRGARRPAPGRDRSARRPRCWRCRPPAAA